MLQQALDSVKSKYSFAKKHDNFINGQWVPPVKGKYFKNVSPINGQTLAKLPVQPPRISSWPWMLATKPLKNGARHRSQNAQHC